VFGFKEIRFNEIPHDKIEKYLKFVRKLFPNAAIVFNTRNITEVLKSGWWRSNYWPGLPKQLSDFGDFASAYVERHRDHAIHIEYDALVQPDRAEVKRLLTFLQETLPQSSIDAVFRGNHSYQNRILTSYVAGRVDYVRIAEHDWWRSNIDEFRVEIAESPTGYLVTGAFLPVIGVRARLFLQAGKHLAEICGTKPTPKIEEMFISNPAAGHAGFEIETPPCGEMYLYAEADGRPMTRVGTIRPGAAVAVRGNGPGPSQVQDRQGAAKR
jgi:hypothetical protein